MAYQFYHPGEKVLQGRTGIEPAENKSGLPFLVWR